MTKASVRRTSDTDIKANEETHMPKDDGIAIRLHEGSGLNHRYQWWGKHTRVLGFVLPVA
jgi:hypothetical protein